MSRLTRCFQLGEQICSETFDPSLRVDDQWDSFSHFAVIGRWGRGSLMSVTMSSSGMGDHGFVDERVFDFEGVC